MPSQVIVSRPAHASMFLVLTVGPTDEDAAAAQDLLGGFAGLTRSVSFRVPGADLLSIIGVGANLWHRLFPDSRPAHLHNFEEIRGDKHTAVSTPGDLLIHLRAEHMGMCFELAKLIKDRLGKHADIVDEVHGFKYFDERDLLGFVDGTENPEGADAEDAVHIGSEDPEFAGGSYVIVQKYLHNMSAWNELSVEEQEKVIGRTKLDDVELPEDQKPSNSHVALNDIQDEEGHDLDIVRENMPFGSIGEEEFGTYFIGYAKDPGIVERMLRNMFLGDPVGNYDRILDFSTAVTGSLYFVPSSDLLEDL